MKRKDFARNFVGAFFGVLIYQSFFDISDPFQNYWVNYLVDIALISIFVFAGLMSVRLLVNRFSLLT